MGYSNKQVSPTTYKYLDSDATSLGTVKSSPGFLHGLVIGHVDVGGSIELYDDTALANGAVSGTIGVLNIITRAAGAQSPQGVIFDVNFGTGLTYNILASAVITFSYN